MNDFSSVIERDGELKGVIPLGGRDHILMFDVDENGLTDYDALSKGMFSRLAHFFYNERLLVEDTLSQRRHISEVIQNRKVLEQKNATELVNRLNSEDLSDYEMEQRQKELDKASVSIKTLKSLYNENALDIKNLKMYRKVVEWANAMVTDDMDNFAKELYDGFSEACEERQQLKFLRREEGKRWRQRQNPDEVREDLKRQLKRVAVEYADVLGMDGVSEVISEVLDKAKSNSNEYFKTEKGAFEIIKELKRQVLERNKSGRTVEE